VRSRKEIVEREAELAKVPSLEACDRATLLGAKRMGFSDPQLARLWKTTEAKVRARRKALGVVPAYKLIDTCGAEFASETPYFYSTYESGATNALAGDGPEKTESEILPSPRRKIMILGGGPNRIGQGIEFDYWCVHAAYALREQGCDVIMVNSNPETVSTDFDTSSQLFFEPLTLEDVVNIHETQKIDGVIVQFGGQTPLNLARPLLEAGVPIIRTSPPEIDRAEDRKLFNQLIAKLGPPQPQAGHAVLLQKAVPVGRPVRLPGPLPPPFLLWRPRP